MNSENKTGPACSIDSRPLEGAQQKLNIPHVDVPQVKKIIEAGVPSVIIIDALWCSDCINQMRNLGPFQEKLKSLGIELYIFTVEGPTYDKFVSEEHKELAMKFYHTPVNAKIYAEHPQENTGGTSVMSKRGREGYPAIFFIAEGAVKFWSIEDVSPQQLDKAAQSIAAVS